MWPSLLGPSWVWDVLLSVALLAGIIVAIAVLLAPREEPRGQRDAAHDWLQTVWHRYEQGDLTPWEFERLVSGSAPRSPHALGAVHAMREAGADSTTDVAAD